LTGFVLRELPLADTQYFPKFRLGHIEPANLPNSAANRL
jgi:hypothetical protein